MSMVRNPGIGEFFCCHPTDTDNPKVHTKLFDSKNESETVIIEDKVMLVNTYCSCVSVYTGNNDFN